MHDCLLCAMLFGICCENIENCLVQMQATYFLYAAYSALCTLVKILMVLNFFTLNKWPLSIFLLMMYPCVLKLLAGKNSSSTIR